VRITLQFLSLSIVQKISAATAVSLDVKDISCMEFINGVELKEVKSICLTGTFKKSDFFITGKIIDNNQTWNL
jgi:hypothetical protein